MAQWKDLDLGVLIPRTVTASDVAGIMEHLQRLLPAYLPYRYGDVEPLRKKMEVFNIDDLLRTLSTELFWTSKIQAAEGCIWMRSGNRLHDSIILSGKSTKVGLTNAVDWLIDIACLFEADFSYIHLFTQQEFTQRDYELVHPYRSGVVTHQLRKYLPDLAWGTVFGPPYLRLFSRDVLLAAPAYLVKELSEDRIYLQLSPSLTDLQTDYDRVDRIREATKDHLGRDAFLDMSYGQMQIVNTPLPGRYRTPEFLINR
jgi:hypothetical protein